MSPTAEQLWQLMCFAWGMLSAWAVVSGLGG